MNFRVILEHFMTSKLTFTTVSDCKDMSECIDYIHEKFPMFNIEKITEVTMENCHD